MIKPYNIFNGFAVTHMLNRFIGLLEDQKGALDQELRMADEDDTGELPYQEIL